MIGGLIGNNVNIAFTGRLVEHIDMMQVKVKVPAILFHCTEILGLPCPIMLPAAGLLNDQL